MPASLRLFALAALLPLAGAASVVGDLESAAEAAIVERFPGATVEVRVVRTGGTVDAAAPLRVELPASASVPRGHTRVDVSRRSGSGWEASGWALLYVAHFDSVVVARRSVSRGDAVAPSDLGAAWLETTSFHGEPLRTSDLAAASAAAAAAGGTLFAERPLREGRALRAGDLRPPYAVDTGGAVRLRYRRGPITLELDGHAREPGFVGDEIRLYCPDTDATYRGRLLAPGLAEWTATL